ncbi:carbohydrate diacid transcriptional activator CdaR [Mycobacterium basiliense]|uniref:Carbohydrate diacid transcriptional activator CdaR n=1 Tax=Mycobacterium basiliense TaxID=2094119 RepID=A0A447GAP8_9MYCO|nr:helix-turn-helix domain-containing protein [Mycobacterium basiliense]VDM87541.1 carbohydrate diacid transcriptional activator CdaR [Mycobacterium basiliense]
MAAPLTHYPESSTDIQGLKIRDLLDEPLMRGARVIAGTDRLDLELTWLLPLAEVASRADSLDGVALYARPEALLANGAALDTLTIRGATALVVDGPAPEEFMHHQFSDELVVIEMSSRVGFGALNRLLAERTLNHELQMMRYAMRVRASLAELFHRGAGLQMLTREVCHLARNPAMALNARGQVAAHCGLGGRTLEALSKSVPQALAAGVPASQRAAMQHTRVDRVAGPDGSTWTCIASQINLGKTSHGWLAILVPFSILDARDLASHRVLAEQATAIIGSEMLRLQSVDEAEERARGDFIEALLHGRFSSDHDLQARADHHEIDINSSFGVFVAHGVLPEPTDNPATGMLRLARHAANICAQPSSRADATVIGDVIVVLRTLSQADDVDLSPEMDDFAQAMCQALEQRCGAPVAVTYGRVAHGAREIRNSYSQARITLGLARQLGRSGVSSYRDLRSFTVLAELTDTEHGQQLIEQFVEPLRTGPNLLETVTSYLTHGGNVCLAARALSVHRNTMLAKLDRISRTIDLDIREPENQFTLWLAIRLSMLANARTTANREATFG